MTLDPTPAVGQIWVSRDSRDEPDRQIELIAETTKDDEPAFKTRPLSTGGSASIIKAANVPSTYSYVRQSALGQQT